MERNYIIEDAYDLISPIVNKNIPEFLYRVGIKLFHFRKKLSSFWTFSVQKDHIAEI
jgi:hypothetical protein